MSLVFTVLFFLKHVFFSAIAVMAQHLSSTVSLLLENALSF